MMLRQGHESMPPSHQRAIGLLGMDSLREFGDSLAAVLEMAGRDESEAPTGQRNQALPARTCELCGFSP
jgi:hypothetical protein